MERGGVLELVPEVLNWQEKREFFASHHDHLGRMGVRHAPTKRRGDQIVRAKHAQARFFDTFFEKERKHYQESPFWKAEYTLTLEPVKHRLRTRDIVVDAGCGEGGCSFLLRKNGVQFIGFDISRHSIEKAMQHAKERDLADDMFFFVGDAEHPPLRSGIADCYILFAVLHHVGDSRAALESVSRILRPGGYFFVHDNNQSALRWAFDLLMKFLPLWEEKAADEPLFSDSKIQELARGTALTLRTRSQVFLPPHFFNLFSDRLARSFLEFSNRVGSRIPWLKENGGIMVIDGYRH